MIILDKNGFRADVSVVQDGKDETLAFLDDQISSSDGNCFIVAEGMACITKMVAFINRQDEFDGVPCNPNDYISINGRKFRCIEARR